MLWIVRGGWLLLAHAVDGKRSLIAARWQKVASCNDDDC
jgi:hypothetical protein